MEIVPTFVSPAGEPIPQELIDSKLDEERQRRKNRYFLFFT